MLAMAGPAPRRKALTRLAISADLLAKSGPSPRRKTLTLACNGRPITEEESTNTACNTKRIASEIWRTQAGSNSGEQELLTRLRILEHLS